MIARYDEATEGLYAPGADANPAAVAAEISRILALPAGSRPYRSVVDFTQSHVGAADVARGGTDTAATLLVTAGDNPGRLRSEAAWAHLCGTAPIPASSGKVTRWRLNRGGDRQANCALRGIVITRPGPTSSRMIPRALAAWSSAYMRAALRTARPIASPPAPHRRARRRLGR
jgi:hypothetical protein